MSLLRALPLWAYFVMLGAAFVTGHLLAYRPDPGMRAGRRVAGRWGSSLLLLAGLLLVSNVVVGTILPAMALAIAGGVLSGRSAPPPSGPRPRERGAHVDRARPPTGGAQPSGGPDPDGTPGEATGGQENPERRG